MLETTNWLRTNVLSERDFAKFDDAKMKLKSTKSTIAAYKIYIYCNIKTGECIQGKT